MAGDSQSRVARARRQLADTGLHHIVEGWTRFDYPPDGPEGPSCSRRRVLPRKFSDPRCRAPNSDRPA